MRATGQEKKEHEARYLTINWKQFCNGSNKCIQIMFPLMDPSFKRYQIKLQFTLISSCVWGYAWRK
jgi:hypothetical protein